VADLPFTVHGNSDISLHRNGTPAATHRSLGSFQLLVRERRKDPEMATFPNPKTGMLLTNFIVSRDIARSRRFYVDVLGGEVVFDGEPTVVALANGWIIINQGGPPTEDKPTVTLTAPDPDTITSFLNIRVANIHDIYEDWTSKGARFLTPPLDRGPEVRCYLRDPDGHLIEVGETKTDFLEEQRSSD
jgi:catechol 2,3-dioxygenase-like lactoylglutathione lyase family enzyme